jgi:transposase
MARAYSNDLRRKFLQAYDEGEGTLEELAEQFRVSVGWAKKISAHRSRTGEVDAPQWRHGPVSRVTPAVQEWIRRQIRAQPDVTLRELRQHLEEAQRLRLSMGRMWLALRQLGLPLKKKRSTRRSRTARKPSGVGKPGAKPSLRSMRSS